MVDAGHFALNRAFTEYELYGLSKTGGLYDSLTAEDWYGSGATELPAQTEMKRKRSRIDF